MMKSKKPAVDAIALLFLAAAVGTLLFSGGRFKGAQQSSGDARAQLALSNDAEGEVQAMLPSVQTFHSPSGDFGIDDLTLAELVHNSDVIVRATVNYAYATGVASLGPTATAHPVLGTLSSELPVVNYSISVAEVFKGSVSVNDVLSMRVLGTMSQPLSLPMGSPGQTYLYFLKSGGGTYGAPYGYQGRMLSDSTVVTYTDPDFKPVPFATGTTGTQFKASIATEIALQLTQTPTPFPTDTPGPHD